MRFSPRTWSLLSLLLFVAAVFFWLKGNEYEARRKKAAPAPNTNSAAHVTGLDLLSTKSAGVPLAHLNAQASSNSLSDAQIEKMYPERLRNTARPLRELVRDDHAVLLANALIDTDEPKSVEIPKALRTKGNPGSYIVQADGVITSVFREQLAAVGAQIVSYVPNNALFVKMSPEGAHRLEAFPGVHAVLPFEPYYKLQRPLLVAALQSELLPADLLLRVTLLPGARDAALNSVRGMGAQILAEELSPFGPQFIVRPPVDALTALAGIPEVQGIEMESPRKAAADLSRVMLGVATNGVATNYLDLSGTNIWVNINDTGIDTNHPALNKVPVIVPPSPIPMAGDDPDGHGTFVASLIAGSGAESPTNAPGSVAGTNSNFRGIAPAAKLIALPLSAGGGTNKYPALNEAVLDSWLIESAARTNYLGLSRSNSLISNNSWTYGRPGYDSAAARFDAAVRDAIPGLTGSQPLLFVFAAGNSGFGNDEGTSGQVDSIESPGTAKNVITVGALESYRLITNITYNITNTEIDEFTGVTNETVITNYPFAAMTDSSNQVASFSSRGNVGIGIEGATGRFKPDVVAPGTMLVAARSKGWNFNGLDTNDTFGSAVFNLHTNINEYRLDSGTTFAAANVSGMLALIQEYFERLAPNGTRGPLSPALMKAILVNGARSLTELYDLTVQKSGNLQGWGLPYLPNMLTSFSTNSHTSIDQKKWRMRLIDQSPTNALATGQSRTWTVTLSTNALTYPLRVTLAWTDPPGNPAVGIKLVNDLDLIVTNLDTGTVFYGNDIAPEADFSTGVVPVAGSVEPVDIINNVENIAIANPKELGRKFSVTVRARRVNVNAVPDYLARTGRTDDIVQDFALVVSSDIGSDPGANDAETYIPDLDVFDAFDSPTQLETLPRAAVAVITNGLPLLTERIGANPTLVSSNGLTNQWNFYVFTNTSISNGFVQVKAGPYVAFVTFNPPNLSRPRNIDADIDLYVSKNPALTNLDPAVLNTALRSTERGGTETITLTNSAIGDVFYIGVKSEDQQGSEFSLMGVSSDLPFEREENGQLVLQGVPIYSYVPDGSARKPAAGTMLAIGISNRRVARVLVETRVVHEDFGDLVGVLSHNRISPILYNHRSLGFGTNVLIFDDNTFFTGNPTRRSDGPGSLNDFAGQRVTGAWILEMIDNAPSHTGRVENLTLRIDRLRDPLLSGQFITGTLRASETAFFPIDVGPGVTNLTFTITNTPLMEVYFRQFELPQTNVFDIKTNSTPPGIKFSFPTTNSAPVSPGTHYLALRNPSASATVAFSIRVDFGFGIRPGDTFNFTGQAPRPSDSATTNTTIFVQNDKLVSRAQVSLRMDHPRLSDLAFTLVSPQGGRILLSENRGGSNGVFGSTQVVTNATSTNTVTYYTVFTDDTNIAQVPIKFGMPVILQNRTNIGTVSSNSFENASPGSYFGGETLEGPWVAASPLEVVTQGAFRGTKAIELQGTGQGGESGITANIATQPGRTYKVTFASRTPGRDYLYFTERFGLGLGTGTNYLRRIQIGAAGAPENLLTNVSVGVIGGIAADVFGGHLYTGDRRFLFRTDLVGRQRTNLVATQNAVTDVEIDTANNWVYWAESGIFTRSNTIKRARLDGKSVQVLAQFPIGQINGIALDVARNTLYYTLSLNTGRDTVQALDIGTRQRRVVATLRNAAADPFDIEFDSGSQTFLFNETGSRIFWKMGRNGVNLTRLFTNSIVFTNGFAFDTASQRIYFNSTNAIYSALQNGSNSAVAVSGRRTINYEEVVHGVQGATGASTPLVAHVIFAGITNYLLATPDWSSNTFYFVGRGGAEPLTIQAQEGSIMIDNVMVERVPETFVLPEEPLQSLVGQRSIGEWRLEVQDTRTGAVLPPGTFDWKLDLNFADPTIFAETLTGGSRFSISTRSTLNNTNRFTPGILRSNQVHYFIIQPCAGAQNLRVLLTGIRNFDSIDLLADSSGIPTGNSDTDDFLLMRNNQNPGSPNGVVEFRLSDKLPAPARLTAKPIYIALRNTFQDVTNIYSLLVTSDGNCTSTGQTASTLLANQPEISGLAGASEFSANQMGLHAMNVPFGAQSVRVNVEADADVSIIAQKDVPPTLDSFSHSQNIPGVSSEELGISVNSGVPLTPGVWYVRVLNNTEEPLSYTITATGDITDELEVISVLAEYIDGQLLLSWNTTEGAVYEIQASADLTHWSAVAEMPEAVSVYQVEDISGSARFYRVIQK